MLPNAATRLSERLRVADVAAGRGEHGVAAGDFGGARGARRVARELAYLEQPLFRRSQFLPTEGSVPDQPRARRSASVSASMRAFIAAIAAARGAAMVEGGMNS